MLNKMSPFFAVLFAILILKEKINLFQGLCVIAAFIGALFVIKPTPSNLACFPALIGLLGGLTAGIAYTCVPSACITAVAQCHGAGKLDRIDKIMNRSLWCCHIAVTACSVVVLIFARPLLGLFTKTPAVVELAIPKVIYYCVGYFIHTFGQVYVAGIKGLKKSSLAFLLNLFSVCIPRLLWIWFVVPLSPTPNTLYLIYPISWLFSAVCLGLGYSYCRKQLAPQPATAT
jgi:Na+-driven multidrug efflux pump